MPMIETRDGTRLYVKAWGHGPAVVLIHGWPLNADSWDPVMNALAQSGYRAIAYDRRGFGRSDQPGHGYDYDTFADDLADVLEGTDARPGAALVGFSMGGGEIARYLSRHGADGIARVALVSSVVPFMARTGDNPEGVPPETFDQMTNGMLEDRAKFMAHFLKDFYGVGLLTAPVSDEQIKLSWNHAMQAGLLPTLAAAKAFATTDFRGDLASFTVPTLVIHGTGDKTVPIEATSRAVARAVPHAMLVEYPGAPHGVFATEPERLIADLTAFLAGRRPEERDVAIDAVTAQLITAPTI